MPTQKPRFSIAIDDDLLRQVDDYKYSHRVKSQNQAINDLLRAGVEELRDKTAQGAVEKSGQPAKGGELSKEAERMIKLLRAVPADQQVLAVELVESVLLAVIRQAPVPAEKPVAAPVASGR